MAIEIAKENLHSRVIGLDLAVDASGDVVFLEANHLSIGIQNLQLSSGPMFGDYTEEVVHYCSQKARSFAFYASLNINQERG